MPIKKIIILAISIPAFITQSLYLYNMYSKNQSRELVSNICYEIKASGSIDNAKTIAIKQGGYYHESEKQITISKNKCSCTLYIEEGIILNKVSKTCKH